MIPRCRQQFIQCVLYNSVDHGEEERPRGRSSWTDGVRRVRKMKCVSQAVWHTSAYCKMLFAVILLGVQT